MTDYYTFAYCIEHGVGYIIRGYNPFIPEGYFVRRHSQECEPCDWVNRGVIKYNEVGTFTVVEPVTVNFDIYESGFRFTEYIDTLTDENGKIITQNELLNDWIEIFLHLK
jgi:hypothetical protein